MSPQELAELNHAVALAEGWKYLGDVGTNERNELGKPWCLSGGKDWWLSPKGHHVCGACEAVPRNYAEDGAEAMRLLEKYSMRVMWTGEHWAANGVDNLHVGIGPTPAIAICRAVVALRAAKATMTTAQGTSGAEPK